MIDGKYSYRLFLGSDEEVETFKDFLKRNNGDGAALKKGFLKPNQLYEVSVDLKCRYLHLVGYCGHIGYPASSKFVNDLNGFIFWYENEYLGFKDVEIIKHIPHASLSFPKEYNHSVLYRVFGEDYKIQNLKLADLFIDYLFKDIKGVEIKAPYSRMYCDIEKYKDKRKEPMAKHGHGYIYTKNIFSDKKYCRNLVYNGKNLQEGIEDYYDDYHLNFTNEVRKIVSKGKKVLILDLHSYSDEQAKLIGKKEPFPDICIGLNKENYDQRILNTIIKRITNKGYSYRINYPYKGSIIPDGLTEEELKNTYSIMIEINKKIYL